MIRNALITILALTVVGGVVYSGIAPRLRADDELRTETTRLAARTVTVIEPKRGTLTQEITLPANIQPYTDAPIYARTDGYLKHWYADIGAHVKAGQLLAEIDTPEIDHQVAQARADFATAQTNMHLSDITSARLQDLIKTDAVSKQEVDNAVSDFQAKKSMTESARAALKRLEETQSFEKIFAPFDGVITARSTDIGALITSGSSTTKELFHITATDRMRVYVNVPEAYSQAAKPGLVADLTLQEFPGRKFRAAFTTTSEAIDPASHTLLVQFDVPNPAGELLPGSYAEIHLKLASSASTFILPINALLFRSEGIRVAIVKDGNRAELARVTLGRDFGNEVEVVAGLKGDEVLIVNPPDSLVSGESVRIMQSDKDK
ncbi:MAG TPA: efflux RND transporter periplasmic adaptor subunit [Terriglobia bacterium]|jgi:RND family efflux transporter MFP subunit